ncbi:hypothetical protein B0H14DRAFT_3431270 [Mycena olivaceomarginata]|nr:hypothetical protein B0H14DRAFT_3431270 [Mycena olivaceomarginata]
MHEREWPTSIPAPPHPALLPHHAQAPDNACSLPPRRPPIPFPPPPLLSESDRFRLSTLFIVVLRAGFLLVLCAEYSTIFNASKRFDDEP